MRAFALLATLAVIGAFLTVLFALVDVTGDTAGFGLLVAASLLAATALSRALRVVHALLLGVVVFAIGLVWYLQSLPYQPELVPIVESNVELLTGQSLHQIRRADVWALAVTPAPVFVTWYLALRRWYGASVLVGTSTLGYFVLSNDAGTTVTLLGVVAAAGIVGFGDLDRRSGTTAGAEYVTLVLALMVIAPLLVTVVPGGAASPIDLGGGSGNASIESSLLTTEGQVRVVGDIQLSPEVRFTVESPEGHYWKSNTYDRYTGEGWVRTGGTSEYAPDRLASPSGPSRRLVQRFTVESSLSTLPAAWRPVRVGDGIAGRALVTDVGDIQVQDPLAEGTSYNVTSRVSAVGTEQLRTVSAPAPPALHERYTQLPDSTPERVAERTAQITQNADGPYESAVAIETWLEQNKEYSLSVDRPNENVADTFLFEMEQGYCTYYATTMVTMLRTQDVPARFATGYAPGEQVAPDRWVARGLDSHAWVEVYFEDVGWVTFDPTPSGPRETTERRRLQTARENNATNVDTAETLSQARSLAEQEVQNGTDQESRQRGPDPDVFQPNFRIQAGGEVLNSSEDEPSGGLPPREHIALGAVVLAGAAAGVRRSGLGRWTVRSARVRWQRRVDPATDVERAFTRLEILLERAYRPRRTGETVTEYIEDIDPPAAARRVVAIREQARYGEEVTVADADEAVARVDQLRGR